MAVDSYFLAQKKALKEYHALQARGEEATPPVLSEIVPSLNRLTQVQLGIMQIPLDHIAGTATKGRTAAFSRSFLPLLDPSSEFASKWTMLYDDVINNGIRESITAYEYYNQFYVIEGNKRVSVSRTLDAFHIEASVTRVLPEPEDSVRYRVYQEFLQFFADTKLSLITFSQEGCFKKLYELVGKTPGTPWTANEILDFQSCYHRFASAYDHPKNPLPTPEAFLKYIEMFGYADSIDFTPSQFQQNIIKVWPEFVVAAEGKPAALLNQPSEKQPNLLTAMLHRVPNPLRCAFIYNHAPDVGGWTYGHDLGRKALESTFGSRVETTTRENVSPQEAAAVIDELANEGYHVIFTASPVLLDACIKQSVVHPETKILNCSLLASYHNVRSYYLRIYEAKFVLGAIAGALADNNRIGYIADYPIYGLPASVNAFALGAQMTNPRAEVILKWSSLPNSNPEAELAAQGIHIISNRDISAPRMESRAFGLYHEQDGQIYNLAMPVWNWEKLYQGIVRSILSGAWEDDAASNTGRALSYYMGMSTGAIDLICSKRIPARVRRLVDLLHERIHSDAFLPLVGPIVDQSGNIRVEADVALTPQEIIHMDYLAQNVIGRLPGIDELNDVAKSLVALQGIPSPAKPARGDA